MAGCSWTEEEVLDYWERPETYDLIIRAIPVGCNNREGTTKTQKTKTKHERAGTSMKETSSRIETTSGLTTRSQTTKAKTRQEEAPVNSTTVRELAHLPAWETSKPIATAAKITISNQPPTLEAKAKKHRRPPVTSIGADGGSTPPPLNQGLSTPEDSPSTSKVITGSPTKKARIMEPAKLKQSSHPAICDGLKAEKSHRPQKKSPSIHKSVEGDEDILDQYQYQNTSSTRQSRRIPCKLVNELKKYPMCSIGRLILFKPNDLKDQMIYATAFYISNGMIMTAAHVFDTKKGVPRRVAVFIPAMKNKCDVYGIFNGFYAIVETPLIHPYHDTRRDKFICQYDICTVKIGKGRLQTNTAPAYDTIEIQDERHMVNRLEPIPLLPQFEVNPLDSPWKPWTVYGYGRCNEDRRMQKIEGTFDHVNTTKKTHKDFKVTDYSLAMHPPLCEGWSGGPWMYTPPSQSMPQAIGCQSGFDTKASYSSYFTEELLHLVCPE